MALWTLSRTNQVSWYHKGETNLDLQEQVSEWQWHHLGHADLHLAPDR